MPVYLTPPPRNPVARALATIVGLVLLAGAFMLGLVAFAIVAGLAFLAAITLWIRSWWATRSRPAAGAAERPAARHDAAIEAEYTVVSRDEDADR